MDALMTVTDASFRELGAYVPYSLDLSTGYDNRDFEAVFAGAPVEGGSLVYVDGTDIGGVVDSVESSTGTDMLSCRGRTWDGIIEGRVICPPAGEDYYSVSGEANAVLAQLVEYLDLGDVFAARDEDSGISVRHSFPRFQAGCTGYAGISEMLRASGAKLRIQRLDGVTWLWAEPVDVIADEADSDVMEFSVTSQHRCVNHLVCAGEGELQDREVLHLYADAAGNVSRTQTLRGVDRIDALYSYTGADAAELLAEGTKELAGYQTSGGVEVDQAGRGTWNVGDVLEARDNRTGTVVQAPIRGKLAKAGRQTGWQLQVEYEVGSDAVTAGTSTSGTAEGSGGGVVYRAGEGISIVSGTISADVTASDLSAVASDASGAVAVANAANSTAAGHAARSDNPHGVTAEQLGLGNVDDTADADKPVSTAVQAALDGKADASHAHDAADVATGVLDAARVPDLDASKVAAGTLDAARIPALDASKVGSGTLDAARIPSLEASKVTGGTFAAARLPLATTSARGAVVVDGTTITISDGIISAQPGGAASFLAAHPVGSYHVGSDPTANGGTWVRYRPLGMPPMWRRTA